MHRRVSVRVSPGIKFCGLPAYDYQLDTRTKSVVLPEKNTLLTLFSILYRIP